MTAALEATLTAWADAYRKGDAVAATALHTEDAHVFPPDAPPIRGHEALRALWGELIESGVELKSLEVTEADVRDDLGYVLGRLEIGFPADDGSVTTRTGKVVDIFKREADGAWKCHTTAWSMDAAT